MKVRRYTRPRRPSSLCMRACARVFYVSVRSKTAESCSLLYLTYSALLLFFFRLQPPNLPSGIIKVSSHRNLLCIINHKGAEEKLLDSLIGIQSDLTSRKLTYQSKVQLWDFTSISFRFCYRLFCLTLL